MTDAPRRGRPVGSIKALKDRRIPLTTISVTPDEAAEIKAAADRAKMPLSVYVRTACLFAGRLQTGVIRP